MESARVVMETQALAAGVIHLVTQLEALLDRLHAAAKEKSTMEAAARIIMTDSAEIPAQIAGSHGR